MHLKELKDNFSMLRLQDVIFDCRDWTLKSGAQVHGSLGGQSWYSMNPSKNTMTMLIGFPL